MQKSVKHWINSLMSKETSKDNQRAQNHAVHTVLCGRRHFPQITLCLTVQHARWSRTNTDMVLSTNALMILMMPNNASSSTQVMVFKWMPFDWMQSVLARYRCVKCGDHPHGQRKERRFGWGSCGCSKWFLCFCFLVWSSAVVICGPDLRRSSIHIH